MLYVFDTDAPLYHYPIVTGILVASNLIIHAVIYACGADASAYFLEFGSGLHPIQWLSHNFLHVNSLHLLVNMLFLLPFGMLAEGKIGWWRMTALIIVVGVAQGAIQQTIMLPADRVNDVAAFNELLEHPDQPLEDKKIWQLTRQWRRDLLTSGDATLGSSPLIFGLLAMSLIWTPANEMRIFFAGPVATVGGFFFVLELGVFRIMGMPVSSMALQMMGVIVGGTLAMAILVSGHLDCEGSDLISIWSGEPFKGAKIVAHERRQAEANAELQAQNAGPPKATVPQLAHQRSSVLPTQSNILPAPVEPVYAAIEEPTVRESMVDESVLPQFDDGIVEVDSREEARVEIEKRILHGDFPAAVRQLAAQRQQDREFNVSAICVGKLAEGLLAAGHIKPALTVLSIGCESYPAFEPRWRIRIATIHLNADRNAIEAIKQLRMVNKETLDSKLREHYVRVAEKAKQLASSTTGDPSDSQ